MSDPNFSDNQDHRSEVTRNTVIREESNGAGALIGGLALAVIVGLGGAAFFMMNQRQTPQAPSKTTIIEKTNTEKVVPQMKAPDVNITMPNPAPAQAPPVTAPEAPPAPKTPAN
jgi:uncharacterized protein HemX